MYAVEWKRGLAPAGWREWGNAAVVGTLLLTCGNGMLVWGLQYIPSNIGAIIPGTCPVWIILIYWLWKKDAKPNTVTIVGIVMGFVGVVLLAQSAATERSHNYFLGVCLAMAGVFFWALGSIYSKMSAQPKSPIQWVAMQMLCGGAVLFALALFSGQWGSFDVWAVTAKSLGGLLYLIICGSCLGYASYIWLLNNSTPALASTFAYVNPLVAVFVGWFFADEVLGKKEAIAAIVIIIAIFLVTVGNNRDVSANASKNKGG